ncbi:MAG: amidohydrolase family protein [Planctomycetota bacterium]|jgi:predicted TIM-barrel fold metal-dependent hydrolase
MIIDVNAYLGHFAFRRLRHNSAPGLLALMDDKKIDKAVVSSASAITYRNTQPGNEEVGEQVAARRDRLIPFAVINPAYAGWEDDLRICRDEFDMRGVRLYPSWHNYKLSDACCLELVSAATERGMLISIPIRAEDYRQRHWLVDPADLSQGDLAALVKARPEARFLLVNGIGFTGSDLGKKDNGLPANYFIEISRLTATLANEMGQLVANLGADRVVFGTGMPFKYPDASLLKVKILEAAESQKEQIRWQNAARLLEGA